MSSVESVRFMLDELVHSCTCGKRNLRGREQRSRYTIIFCSKADDIPNNTDFRPSQGLAGWECLLHPQKPLLTVRFFFGASWGGATGNLKELAAGRGESPSEKVLLS